MHTFTGDNGTVFKFNPDLSEVRINVHKEDIESLAIFEKGLREATIDGYDLLQFIEAHQEAEQIRKIEQGEQHG